MKRFDPRRTRLFRTVRRLFTRCCASDTRFVLAVWAGWAIVFLALAAWLPARFNLQGPDRATPWTADETAPGADNGHLYLDGPFMNGHVAWDSEYYLSIALHGYLDPAMRAIAPNFYQGWLGVEHQGDRPGLTSLNWAFWPAYPYAMRLVMQPFRWLGLADLAAATLAGVIISMAGTLAAMLALQRLGAGIYGRPTGRRAAFYLLVTPGAMFLGMVYTEGLFLGLSFLSLALAREGRHVPAGVLAFFATLTKAAGAMLVLPLAVYWYRDHLGVSGVRLSRRPGWLDAVFAVLPVVAYGLFLVFMAEPFHFVEQRYFGRGLFALGFTIESWALAIWRMGQDPMAAAYYLVEFGMVAVAVWSLAGLWRREPVLTVYGALVLVFSLTSGVAQGMHRYALALPSLFLVPARRGRNAAFDRVWVLGSLPFMLAFFTAFVFNLWAG